MNRHLIFFLLLFSYVLLINSPLVFAWMADLPARPWRDELSSAFGMIGLVIILLEFVLSGRFKNISAPIGIDIIMRSHQLMGRVVIIILLIHPVFYSLPNNSLLPWDTTLTQSTRLDMIDTITGLLAWLGLALIVLLALRRDAEQSNYEDWRRSHLILAIATACLALVHAFGAGRYTEFASLDILWFSIGLLALFALIHVYFTVPLQQRSRAYLVDSVSKVANRTWRLVLKPEHGQVMDYLAGQFVWLKFSGPFLSLQEHPFSISSHPANQQALEFTIKEFGDFTNHIGELPIGAKVYVDGPYGHFTMKQRYAEGVMLIAGGVGIAPIVSILRQLAEECYSSPVVLITCHGTLADLPYKEELVTLSKQLNLKTIHMTSLGTENTNCLQGQLSRQVISDHIPAQASSWLYFVCGPSGMMDTAESALLQLGVPLNQIVSERFRYDTHSVSRRSRNIIYSMFGVLGITGFVLLGFIFHL
ncbi:MAG: ferric reductase-like transmembrane domain-containing protein [Gammaproteobacteria bacterium]|nr:ferric reductase-like transmembrane domain-containing protein [Gammaproteobacteria bacterium]